MIKVIKDSHKISTKINNYFENKLTKKIDKFQKKKLGLKFKQKKLIYEQKSKRNRALFTKKMRLAYSLFVNCKFNSH